MRIENEWKMRIGNEWELETKNTISIGLCYFDFLKEKSETDE